MLSKTELDKLGCSNPDCKDPNCGPVYFHGSCHPKGRTYTYYEKGSGVITVICAECEKKIVEIAVLGYGTSIVHRDKNAPVKSPVLLNAAAQAKWCKGFGRPSNKEIKAVSPKDLVFVKVAVPRKSEDGTVGERFWVRVEYVDKLNGRMVGVVDNDLAPACQLDKGDRIWLHRDNIYEIMRGKP